MNDIHVDLLPGQQKNPIFIEFYSHTGTDCYKVLLPWSKYKTHVLVLCEVSKGIRYAKKLAMKHLQEHLKQALKASLSA